MSVLMRRATDAANEVCPPVHAVACHGVLLWRLMGAIEPHRGEETERGDCGTAQRETASWLTRHEHTTILAARRGCT